MIRHRLIISKTDMPHVYHAVLQERKMFLFFGYWKFKRSMFGDIWKVGIFRRKCESNYHDAKLELNLTIIDHTK